jgi:hypothetical protein
MSASDNDRIELVESLVRDELKLRPQNRFAWFSLALCFVHSRNLLLLGATSTLQALLSVASSVLRRHLSGTKAYSRPSPKKETKQEESSDDVQVIGCTHASGTNIVVIDMTVEPQPELPTEQEPIFEAVSQGWWNEACDQAMEMGRREISSTKKAIRCLRVPTLLPPNAFG